MNFLVRSRSGSQRFPESIVLWGAIFCLSSTTGFAQPAGFNVAPGSKVVIVEADDSKNLDSEDSAATPSAESGDSAPASGKKAVDDRPQRRLALIQKLNFDRKPSTILKVWREPIPKESPPEAATEKSDEQSPEEFSDVASALETVNGRVDPKLKADREARQAKVQAARQAAEVKRKAAEDAAFQKELDQCSRDVTLSRWTAVRDFLTRLPRDEAKALYARMLASLREGAFGRMNVDPDNLQQLVSSGADIHQIQKALSKSGHGPGAPYVEKNLFAMNDLLGLLLASPGEFETEGSQQFGQILEFTVHNGFDIESLLSQPEIVAARNGTRIVPQSDPEPESASNVKPAESKSATSNAGEPKEKLPRAPYQPTARDLARILVAARDADRAGDFLPTIEEAGAAKDGAGLNLYATHVLAKHLKDERTRGLELAWTATQAVLEIPLPPEPPRDNKSSAASTEEDPSESAGRASGKSDPGNPTSTESPEAIARQKRVARFQQAKATRAEALTRAVELAPKIRKELGQHWLDDSFGARMERGKEILTAIGSGTSSNLSSRYNDQEFRKKGLDLQKTAVTALLRSAADSASEWKEPLTVLAMAWLKEAEVSHQLDDASSRRSWRRDRYGNYFMWDDDWGGGYRQNRYGQASPITIEDVLELAPGEAWLKGISHDLLPKFEEMLAQLHLKLEDEAVAFPHIERLAKTHPKRAKVLAEEFVRVWTTTHNPNEKRDGNNPYYYYWSYERRAERIPLTRSKQERNLQELAEWVKKLKALPVGDLDETLLTRAFTTAHSKAEVYKIESIEAVFGSLDSLKPRTLAELIQQMRGNLAGVWRMPDLQRQNSTNRKQKDIRAEVLRGYEVARVVVQRGLEQHPGHWALLLADACVRHDEIDFEKEAEKSSDFSARRADALTRFADAATAYAKAVPEIPVDEQTVQPFEMWFHASLGCVDLERITADKNPDPRQPPLIKAALAAVPEDAIERHLSQFANGFFTKTTNAKAELKQRYLKAGFEIVGDHKMAREARKLHDYYSDLVREIKLETKIDGADSVGHGRPFGVFVNLVHTKEIEREAGGFGKYLQNQANSQMFFYNFGRPLENYRDKFQDFVKKAFDDRFEVMSVTFQAATVNSRALPEYGWRTTPYAYLLLKSKGPEVDKIPSLRMDLDFLDTSGFAVLPIESPLLPIDSRAELPPARPAREIVVTQTLDERQSDKGKLILEIRVTARGLVPELKELLDIKPAGFTVEKTEDRGLAVLEFDADASENAIRSERQWMISLAADAANEHRPKSFQFASAKIPVKEMVYQRYEDADLKAVSADVSLESQYGNGSWNTTILLAIASIAAVVLGLALWRWVSSPQTNAEPPFSLPADLTPFTAIGFLRDLESRAKFEETARRELSESIAAIERHYFETATGNPPDVERVSRRWLEAALKQI